MEKNARVYVAGHRGLVGKAILDCLSNRGYTNILKRTHSELDLTNQNEVKSFFETEKPEYVFLAAAKVGGILANNTYRADFIFENLMIQSNVIHQSYLNNIKKLLYLGSTCIYPKDSPQPIKEEYLLTSSLETTNEPYAIAKIAGLKMCESYNLQHKTNFISVMPTNIYGYNDNYDLEKSHVLPALLRKIYLGKLLYQNKYEEIKNNLALDNSIDIISYLSNYGVTSNKVEVWGTGSPRREFLWSEDLADACVYIMENIDTNDLTSQESHINIGSGTDISIKDLAYLISDIVGFKGGLFFNSNKPDGTARKLTDVSKLHSLGWKHSVSLENGIRKLVNWYAENSTK